MAREPHDREDLLAEATALVERVSLRLAGYDQPVVVGFRRDSSPAFYFGAERVYQFTSQGRLRRAMIDELMYKADGGELVELRRHRTHRAVELRSRILSPAERQAFLDAMRGHLAALERAIIGGQVVILGQVPADADVAGRIGHWLEALGGTAEIADSPRSG